MYTQICSESKQNQPKALKECIRHGDWKQALTLLCQTYLAFCGLLQLHVPHGLQMLCCRFWNMHKDSSSGTYVNLLQVLLS